MGRILRFTLSEDVVTAIDFGSPTPGKILINNAGTVDIRIGYERTDVRSTGGSDQFFTLNAGVQYIFDVGPQIGFLAQNQQLFVNSPDGDCVIEVWIANNM